MAQQLTLAKDDLSVVEKMKAIQTLNMQREQIGKYLERLHEIEQMKEAIDGLAIVSIPRYPQRGDNNFTLPIDFMEDVVRQMLAYYKGVDELLIDEAKQLMK
jgi:hypothetical protein